MTMRIPRIDSSWFWEFQYAGDGLWPNNS